MDKILNNYAYPSENYNINIPTNDLNPEKLGIKNDGNIRQVLHNFKSLPKYLDGLMYKGENTINNSNNKLPYKNFRIDYPEKDYPTNNRNSYFIKSGFCPVTAKNKKECLSKDNNYIWIPNPIGLPNNLNDFFNKNSENNDSSGYCFKPRFSYVNNESDSNITNGILPSLMNNINDMDPSNYFKILSGKPIMGSNDNSPPRFRLLPCIENFSQKNKISASYIKNMEPHNEHFLENFADKNFNGHLINSNTNLGEYYSPSVEEFYVEPNSNNNNMGVEYNKSPDPMTWMPTQDNGVVETKPEIIENSKPKDVVITYKRDNLILGMTPDIFLLISLFLLAFIFLACQQL